MSQSASSVILSDFIHLLDIKQRGIICTNEATFETSFQRKYLIDNWIFKTCIWILTELCKLRTVCSFLTWTNEVVMSRLVQHEQECKFTYIISHISFKQYAEIQTGLYVVALNNIDKNKKHLFIFISL